MFQTPVFNRRQAIAAAVSIGGSLGMSDLLQSITAVAGEASENDQRHCVLLWMSGGPSQIDTFDMKPAHKNGGSIKEIATAVPGLRFSEHLPQLARQADQLAILRGMATKEGDHQRGTTVMRTGHIAGGPVRYPAIGCSLSKSLRNPDSKLPHYVTVAPGPFARGSLSPGFLGPKFAATSVSVSGPPAAGNFAQLRVDHLQPHGFVGPERFESRLALWESMQAAYLKTRNAPNTIAQDTVYRSAIDMLGSNAKDAFDLSAESDTVREAYGRGTFGQGCLMARRLIERGVPLVEVTLGDGLGWDTHANNFEQVQRLCQQLDAGWSTLMTELADRGLLEKTTILWAGEFGRTPAINSNGGRDHFPQAFSCVLAGGGVAGGQAFGATSTDGMEVVDGKIDQQDLLATLCKALGVDPTSENIAEGGRPIAIAEGNPVEQVLL
ncbi:hypothetical protein Enr13x_35230 [Stieleria neptunia]|uniref:Sulfatase n=1 Tax=Stieleria neptunia TaxID=2527979 RepID=A0A518HS38_9BACT|nr:DUF1501 domain-containing protein [Stieleria neptunia]QDV43666.1 hypothetical protein Enr13x_35230 [Stieleria neptunia]